VKRFGFLLLAGLLGACTASNMAPSAPTGQADVKRRTDIRLELATAHYTGGQAEIALQELNRALELSPRRADVLGLRALVLMQVGDNDAAGQSLREALRIEPDNPSLQNNMGWFLCQKGEFDKAMSYFERALATKSYTSPQKALLNAGLCRIRQGERPQAEAFLRRVLDAEPANLQAHAGLARLAYDRADYTRARRHLLKVVESEQAAAENFLMAVLIERKLGDADSEQSLLAQWRRRFPQSPQLTAYLRGETDDK
jgi:type IV pilus assembly protein PilF